VGQNNGGPSAARRAVPAHHPVPEDPDADDTHHSFLGMPPTRHPAIVDTDAADDDHAIPWSDAFRTRADRL